MQHTVIGDISVVVGHYPDPTRKDKQTGEPLRRNRSRGIGTLMRTDHDDGPSRFWLKIHGDALSPSLLMLALRAKGKAGDSDVIMNVYANEPPPAQSGGSAPPPSQSPEVDEDGVPF